jgi:hypothetical protein
MNRVNVIFCATCNDIEVKKIGGDDNNNTNNKQEAKVGRSTLLVELIDERRIILSRSKPTWKLT